MKLCDFDYVLPKELIADYPVQKRTDARLLFFDRQSGTSTHHRFFDVTRFLRAGDVLVLNNTKVIPARLMGKKSTGARAEIFLLHESGKNRWKVLLKPGRRLKKGALVHLGQNGVALTAEVVDDSLSDSRERTIEFKESKEKVKEGIQRIGHVPLPPYIKRPDTTIDCEYYQTVFAEKEGAVASPTAGLHFDQDLIKDIERLGVQVVYVTLHVSYSTFRRLSEEDLLKQELFEEEFEVTSQAAGQLNRALSAGRRIIATGTTSVRTLESAVDRRGLIQPQKGKTRLFIKPPYSWKVVQGLITNFHLPKSSLLTLVAAFVEQEKLLEIYQEAIRERYRFYSYGDAMMII